ncbi:hypothetical protein GGS21DRAFT_274625 [Xylaria nigripes]|nr:hypothetical protein GGS21DRAFT_274625 [Xylaria nigripes]
MRYTILRGAELSCIDISWTIICFLAPFVRLLILGLLIVFDADCGRGLVVFKTSCVVLSTYSLLFDSWPLNRAIGFLGAALYILTSRPAKGCLSVLLTRYYKS